MLNLNQPERIFKILHGRLYCRIWFSKCQGGGAEHVLGNPTGKVENLGNDESTNVGDTVQKPAQTNDLVKVWNSEVVVPGKWS